MGFWSAFRKLETKLGSKEVITIDEPQKISVKCECGKKLSVKLKLAGKRIKCPGCGEVIVVPAVAEDFEYAEDSTGVRTGYVGLALVIFFVAIYSIGAVLTGRKQPFDYIILVTGVAGLAGIVISIWAAISGSARVAGIVGAIIGPLFIVVLVLLGK